MNAVDHDAPTWDSRLAGVDSQRAPTESRVRPDAIGLLVNSSALATCAATFADRGYAVDRHADASDAERSWLSSPPSLVVLGASPRELELLERLRWELGERSPRALLVGAGASESDVLRGYEAGADAYVSSPTDEALLAHALGLLQRPPACVADQAPLSAGDKFGRYRVERAIGRGTFGEVFLARDLVQGRRVALKLLHEDQSRSPEARRRFLRESEALARVDHPHVVGIHDHGVHEGRSFCCMEYVSGPTLQSAAWRSRGLDAGELLSLLEGLLGALVELDARGLVHRDIKPSNVILRDGDPAQPVLIDFGLAKSLTAECLTDPEIVLGTPGYLAPEAFFGTGYDHRSDLFALGTLACFAAKGRELFPDLGGLSLISRMARPIPLPESVPLQLMPLMASLIETQPERRCQHASDALAQVRWLRQLRRRRLALTCAA